MALGVRPLMLAMLGLVMIGGPGCQRSSSKSHDSGPAGLTLPPAAPLDVVVLRDGDDYSVAIARGADPCILYPEAMFETAMCPIEARPVTSPPPGPSRSRLVGLGLVRFADQGEVRMGQLTVSLNRMDHAHEPTQELAEAFAQGMVASLIKSVPGAVVATGGPTVQLMTTDTGLRVARIAYDVERPSGDSARLEHAISFTAWSTDGAYTFSLSAKRQYAQVMDALAEQMASSLRVAHPAPP